MSASLIKTQYTLEHPLVLERAIAAPLEMVWQAHTQADHLNQWWGPVGLVNRVISLDLRPGGIFLYSMTTPEGKTMWGKWNFLEVQPPTRLVYILSFSTESGKTIRYPEEPAWPLEMYATTTFASKGEHTVIQQQLAPWNASEQEHATFAIGKESMKGGFNATWDELDRYL